MKDKVLELFQEDNGGLSMMRFLVFFIIVAPYVAWGIWIFYHSTSNIPDMPSGVTSLQFGALGAKYLQKGKEQQVPLV